MNKTVFPCLCLSALLVIATGLKAQTINRDFDVPEPVAVADLLPSAMLRSEHYSLAPYAKPKNNFYTFEINTDEATYEVSSIAMLRVRLHEINTVAAMNFRLAEKSLRSERDPGGRRGVGSERVVDILADPIGTAATLAGNLQYNVEQTLSGASNSPATATTVGERDLNPGPHKRAAAAQLNVDVYSTNPHLQALLTTLEAERSAGNTSVSISPLIQGAPSKSFGSGLLDQRVHSQLKNNAGEAVNAAVAQTLASMGISESLRIRFLTHPAYSPRTRLYVASYLELIAPLKNIDRIMQGGNLAATESDALAFVGYLRMLAFYQLQHGALESVQTQSTYPTLRTLDGNAVMALPLDYLEWSETVADAAASLVEFRRDNTLNLFSLLLAGRVSELARTELEARGIRIIEHYSF